MKRSELLARIVIIAGVLLTITAPIYIWARTPLIHAQMSEDGGWTPNTIRAKVGKPLQLHFTSDDVMHGFAIGQMDRKAVDIEPGKVTDITLTFDKPGVYTFFCTRWCGVNHWRMRGTIEVTGLPAGAPAPPSCSASRAATASRSTATPASPRRSRAARAACPRSTGRGSPRSWEPSARPCLVDPCPDCVECYPGLEFIKLMVSSLSPSRGRPARQPASRPASP